VLTIGQSNDGTGTYAVAGRNVDSDQAGRMKALPSKLSRVRPASVRSSYVTRVECAKQRQLPILHWRLPARASFATILTPRNVTNVQNSTQNLRLAGSPRWWGESAEFMLAIGTNYNASCSVLIPFRS
jgi:hypothetical protein